MKLHRDEREWLLSFLVLIVLWAFGYLVYLAWLSHQAVALD